MSLLLPLRVSSLNGLILLLVRPSHHHSKSSLFFSTYLIRSRDSTKASTASTLKPARGKEKPLNLQTVSHQPPSAPATDICSVLDCFSFSFFFGPKASSCLGFSPRMLCAWIQGGVRGLSLSEGGKQTPFRPQRIFFFHWHGRGREDEKCVRPENNAYVNADPVCLKEG